MTERKKDCKKKHQIVTIKNVVKKKQKNVTKAKNNYKVRNKYRKLSNEKKYIKIKYVKSCYKNMSVEHTRKLKEYRKIKNNFLLDIYSTRDEQLCQY